MAATKVKNQWGPWSSLNFYQDAFGFQVKMVISKSIMRHLFFFQGRNYRRCEYSISVSGTTICLSKELSKPIFDFRFFSIFGRAFIWKSSQNHVIFHDILDTNDRFCLIRHFSDKVSLKKKKKEKSKIGFDSSLEKHIKVPESLIEYSYRL